MDFTNRHTLNSTRMFVCVCVCSWGGGAVELDDIVLSKSHMAWSLWVHQVEAIVHFDPR